MIKIVTFNVNSIRMRVGQLIDWIKEHNPDVICLQELKCIDNQFPFEQLSDLPFNIEILGQKAYNGVAILSKFKLYDINTKLPLYNLLDQDNDSRYLEAKFDYNNYSIKIASIYVPNGGPKVTDGLVNDITITDSFKNKILFYKRLQKHFEVSLKNNENVLFCGDYNVCPILEKDVYSITKDGDINCNIKERNEFQKFIDLGLIDIFRKFYKDKMEYTWWGYRPKTMLERNQGFRIDAILTNEFLFKNIDKCYIEKNIRFSKKPSDHVPLVCEIR